MGQTHTSDHLCAWGGTLLLQGRELAFTTSLLVHQAADACKPQAFQQLHPVTMRKQPEVVKSGQWRNQAMPGTGIASNFYTYYTVSKYYMVLLYSSNR